MHVIRYYKELRTRNYLDKWLGSDIAVSGPQSIPHTSAGRSFDNVSRVPDDVSTAPGSGVLLGVGDAHIPVIAGKWVVANNNVASSLFVEEVEQHLGASSGAYFLDMTDVIIESEADAFKFLSILSENEKLSAPLLGLIRGSERVVRFLSDIKCAVPIISASMSISNPAKVLQQASASEHPPQQPQPSDSAVQGTATDTPSPSTFTYFGAVSSALLCWVRLLQSVHAHADVCVSAAGAVGPADLQPGLFEHNCLR